MYRSYSNKQDKQNVDIFLRFKVSRYWVYNTMNKESPYFEIQFLFKNKTAKIDINVLQYMVYEEPTITSPNENSVMSNQEKIDT